MRHLKLHHIIRGSSIKTLHGFIDRKKHQGKIHLTHSKHHLTGSGTAAVKKDYEEVSGGKLKKRHIKPLHFKI